MNRRSSDSRVIGVIATEDTENIEEEIEEENQEDYDDEVQVGQQGRSMRLSGPHPVLALLRLFCLVFLFVFY